MIKQMIFALKKEQNVSTRTKLKNIAKWSNYIDYEGDAFLKQGCSTHG